jgi:fumarate hydratase class II
VTVDVESTTELANAVRAHIEAQVARALADDETMRVYVARALASGTKDQDSWLREAINQSIRYAAAAEINKQIAEQQEQIRDKVTTVMTKRLPAIVDALVDRITVR